MKILPEYVVELIQDGRTCISGVENPEYNPMKPKIELYVVEKILDVFDEVQYSVRRILAKSTQLFVLDVEKATGKATWNGTRALYRKLYGVRRILAKSTQLFPRVQILRRQPGATETPRSPARTATRSGSRGGKNNGGTGSIRETGCRD